MGSPVVRRGYGVYGETDPAQMVGTTSAGTSAHPFGYTGRRWDPDLGLYYYRARWYDPQLGTFLQTDPIGSLDYINLYAYVGLEPGNGTDPSGMYENRHSNGLTDRQIRERDLARQARRETRQTPAVTKATREILPVAIDAKYGATTLAANAAGIKPNAAIGRVGTIVGVAVTSSIEAGNARADVRNGMSADQATRGAVGRTAAQVGSSTAGTITGASAGSLFGPVGAVVGGIIGGVMGGNASERIGLTDDIGEAFERGASRSKQ
jgi:RHS repeat-associated protein